MDVFGRTLENAAGLTGLVSWSHMRAEAEGWEVSMKMGAARSVFSPFLACIFLPTLQTSPPLS